VQIVYQRGLFDCQASEMTAVALLYFTMGMVLVSVAGCAESGFLCAEGCEDGDGERVDCGGVEYRAGDCAGEVYGYWGVGAGIIDFGDCGDGEFASEDWRFRHAGDCVDVG